MKLLWDERDKGIKTDRRLRLSHLRRLVRFTRLTQCPGVRNV